MANEPALILADEPSGSLDSQSSEEILALLAELNSSQQTSIVVVTHDRRVAQATKRILRMQDGKIVSDHRITDPLEEDLRMFAQSQFGQTILERDQKLPEFVAEEDIAALRQLLQAFDDGIADEKPVDSPPSIE